jgi:hypothetical protein
LHGTYGPHVETRRSAARRNSVILWTFLLAAALVLSGCGSGSSTIDGVLVGMADYHDNAAGTCTSTRAKQGDQVRVLSGSGEILGVGSISESELVSMIECRLYFTVEDVGRADFYTVEVSGRGGPTWSRDEMVELDWSVALRG